MGYNVFDKVLYDNIINNYFEDFVYNFYIYGDYVNEVEYQDILLRYYQNNYELSGLLNRLQILFGIEPSCYFEVLPSPFKVEPIIRNNIIKIDGIEYVTNIKYIQFKITEYNYEYISSVNSHTESLLHRGILWQHGREI